MNDTTLTKDSIVELLNRFEAIAEKENFDLVQDMVHEHAVFRFNDGDDVGKPAVRGAFEKTWKDSNANVKKTRFNLTDNAVLTFDTNAPHRYHHQKHAQRRLPRRSRAAS